MNLSDLFYPDTFLNALRQRSARQLKVAIDELKLVSCFEKNKISAPTAIQVDGLWLQGCHFDGRQLADIKDNSGSSRELVNLPVCYLAWIASGDEDPYKDQTVETPIYHSLDREKLLCTISVPTHGEKRSRIISGAAIFLNGSGA